MKYNFNINQLTKAKCISFFSKRTKLLVFIGLCDLSKLSFSTNAMQLYHNSVTYCTLHFKLAKTCFIGVLEKFKFRQLNHYKKQTV